VLRFGVIAEGLTDQTVTENILFGYFQGEEEPWVRYVQPPSPTPISPAPPGGWTLVFTSLRQGKAQEALQFNDYVVIQIDTDVQDEIGFDVPRSEGGNELSIDDRVRRVIERLKKDIDSSFYEARKHQILFAITVDTIECWLLPFLYEDDKAAKTTGCFEPANRALRKANVKALYVGDNASRVYEAASSSFRKRKRLTECRDKNPSLELFVKQLDVLQIARTVNSPPSSKEPDGDAAT